MKPSMHSLYLTAGTLSALLSVAASAGDWPQYRGVSWNGTTAESMPAWPANGPSVVWKAALGPGFSSFTVVGGKAYTIITREIEGAKREVCVALDAKNGKELWAAPLGMAKYDGGGDSGTPDNKGGDGPRSTPTIDGNRVYCLDARQGLMALDAANGQKVWGKDLVQEFGAKVISWQNAASVVLDGDLLFVCGGGADQALLAFHKKDGSVAWKGESDAPTHATPTLATIHGQRQVIFFTQKGLVSCDTVSGKVLWRHPHKYSVSTAASPVVSGDMVYCSAGYGVGASAAKISKDGDAWTAKELWRISGDDIGNHWSSPVVKDGYVYGIYGCKRYGVAPLKCFELATGKEMWAQPGFGQGNVILAGNQLLALGDAGQLVLIEAQSTGYKEVARAKVLEGKCWSTPVLAGGRVFVRSTKEAACLDFSKSVAQR